MGGSGCLSVRVPPFEHWVSTVYSVKRNVQWYENLKKNKIETVVNC